jgi:hypothetical protein
MQKARNSKPAFKIVRGSSGLWEVMEEGIRETLGLFRAPQAALSYACDLAAAHKGSLVMVFDRIPARTRGAMAAFGPGSARLQ